MIAFPESWRYVPSPSPSGSPSPAPSCTKESDLCTYVYQVTENRWLAESSFWVLEKPLRILLIIVVALIARALIHRMITRVINHTIEAPTGNLFKPLRERIPVALRTASVLPTERRRQRATALASVLRSIASAVVFVVTAMLVIGELGYNLAPILASAGIVGLAVGFGAQNLVKDFLAGLFILLEDQFGVGDIVDVGTITGTVKAVGLRITTIRDERGVVWYIRNGEIIRVGNKSQGWALAIVDVPVKFAFAAAAEAVLRDVAARFRDEPEWAELLTGPTEVLGIEEITTETTTLRTTARTTIEAQPRVARELRGRITEALHEAGLGAQAAAVSSPPDQAPNAGGEAPRPEPAPAGPAGPEPARTEPARTEPARPEPARTEPARPEPTGAAGATEPPAVSAPTADDPSGKGHRT